MSDNKGTKRKVTKNQTDESIKKNKSERASKRKSDITEELLLPKKTCVEPAVGANIGFIRVEYCVS
ncbi:hypothetical protein J6590_053079 [Homalodisca vitripennis]|nr:hypothetical protein J6590_053079 [Homalodisca vitripennis]